jgi:methyltransferase (TIGR00027 family)
MTLIASVLVSSAIAVQPVPLSKTSLLAATLRAIGAKHPEPSFRNPDALAARFLSAADRALLTEFPPEALDLDYDGALARLSPQDRGSVTTMFLRTQHIDAALKDALRDGIRQVIILGAGLDSRGYRFRDQLQGVRFIEVDQASTQEYKKQRVRAVFGTLPADVLYVPVDFTKDDLHTQLAGVQYSEQQRSLYIWEGVTTYLPESAVTSTLLFLRQHASPGSLMVFDYTLASDPRIGDPATRFARWGEPWLFGFPGTSAEDTVARAGLRSVSDRSMSELEMMYARRPDGTPGLPTLSADQGLRRMSIVQVP